MIILCALLGLFTGSLINWAADVLPRFAVDQSTVPADLHPRFTLAAWQHARKLARGPVSVVNLRVRPSEGFVNIAIELLTALLFAYVWLRFNRIDMWLAMSVVCAFFILIALIDLKYRLVLNVMIYPAAVLAVFVQMFVARTDLMAVIIGGAFGLSIFLAAAWLRPGDLGGGDVKLATLIGLIFAFPLGLWALFIGIVAGGLAAIGLLMTRRLTAKSHIPYAPFLCLGALIALLYNPLASILPL